MRWWRLALLATISDPMIIFKGALKPNLPGMGPARWLFVILWAQALLCFSHGLVTCFGNINLMSTASITFGSNKSGLAFGWTPHLQQLDPYLFFLATKHSLPQFFETIQRIFRTFLTKSRFKIPKKHISPQNRWHKRPKTRITRLKASWGLRSTRSLLERDLIRCQVYPSCSNNLFQVLF